MTRAHITFARLHVFQPIHSFHPFFLSFPRDCKKKCAEAVGRVFGAQLSDAVMAILGDWQRSEGRGEGWRQFHGQTSLLTAAAADRGGGKREEGWRGVGEEMRGIAGNREAKEKGGNVSISSRTVSKVMGTSTTFPQGEIYVPTRK